MRFIVVGCVVSCLFLPFTMRWFSTLRRHKCGARWTLVWSVSRSSVEQTGHKCGINACFNQLFRLFFCFLPLFLSVSSEGNFFFYALFFRFYIRMTFCKLMRHGVMYALAHVACKFYAGLHQFIPCSFIECRNIIVANVIFQ